MLKRLHGKWLQTIGAIHCEPLIAKFYRPERWSKEQIQEEHQFTLDLKAMELPVVAPVANEDGNTLHECEGFLFILNRKPGWKHVAIINDVATTGATVNEITRLLKRNNVERVDIWSIARTPES